MSPAGVGPAGGFDKRARMADTRAMIAFSFARFANRKGSLKIG